MKMFLIALFALSVGAFAQDEDDIRIMKMMNDLRREQGVKPLKFHPKLDSIANEWVKYIANKLKDVKDEDVHNNQRINPKYLHVNLSSRAFIVGLIPGLNAIEITENVAFSSGAEPSDIVAVSFSSWKNSPGHYSAMINESYKDFGYSALKLKNGRTFYITVFAEFIK